MDSDGDLEWRPGRVIPASELTFRSDTSGGPGGQHANRSATRITLLWNLDETTAFSDLERKRLETALASRRNKEGVVQVRSSSERSAKRNREECLEILAMLVREALKPQRKRVRTKPTKSSVERRLDDKKRRSQTKQQRRRPTGEE